jgi:hypothetical protein
MSLRKSPQLTPALLAAARRNARHSTGPRSPSAKQNSKLNALKHGAYVADDNQRQAMRALGEDLKATLCPITCSVWKQQKTQN